MTKYTSKDKKQSTNVNKKCKQNADIGYGECVIKFIILIALIFGLTFLYFHRYVYKTNYFSKNGIGDISIRHFAKDVNTMMCQAYDVSSWKPADFYLVSGRAKIVSHKRNILKRKNSELFPGSSDRDSAFFLLEGSYIKVNACRRFDVHWEKVDILLFKGDKSWKDWKSGKCDDCPLKRKTLSSQFCEEGGETVLKYHVEDRDTYYIAVTKRNGYQAALLNVRATLEIMRTTFDTSSALQECHMTTDCVLNLTYSSDVDIVVKFRHDQALSQLTSECKYRVMFWVGVFAILPGCIITIALYCCCCCIACTKNGDRKKGVDKQFKERKEVSSNDKTNLVKNGLPSGYNSIIHAGNIQVV